MAHYAFIDSDMIVQEVITGRDPSEVVDGITDWEEFYSNERENLTAVRTSYNTFGGEHREGGTPFRYNYAGIGYSFDPSIGDDGAFIPPQPFPSWVLSTETCLWGPPVEQPTDGAKYDWDEATTSWIPAE